MARVVSISSDLLLGSRVEAMLGAAGHEVSSASSLAEAPLEGVEILVADLDAESPEALAAIEVPVLAYYSHVEVETRAAAEGAGIDLVVPRSRMSRELPRLVDGLLGG